MSFSTYIFIGSIYSLFTLLYNIFVVKNDYNNTKLSFKLAAYIFDLFLWPLGIVVDALNKLKGVSK